MMIPLAGAAALALSACSQAPVPELADVDTAIEAHRYFAARDKLLTLREHEGASPDTSWRLAQTMLELGDGYSAERYLNELAAAHENDARWTSLRAHSLILQGKARAACDLLEAFTGERPDDGAHDNLMVWAMMEHGTPQEAQAWLDQALERHPTSADLAARAGRLAWQRGDWVATDAYVDRALALDPQHYEALLLRGEREIAMMAPEDALETYRTAAEIYPDFAIPRANVGGLLLDLDRLEEARPVLNEALAIHPEFALHSFNAARYQAMSERWTEARQTLQAIPSEWKQSFPAATLLEGEIEAALGNHAMARALYEQLADDPRFTAQVSDLLERLPPA